MLERILESFKGSVVTFVASAKGVMLTLLSPFIVENVCNTGLEPKKTSSFQPDQTSNWKGKMLAKSDMYSEHCMLDFALKVERVDSKSFTCR